LPKGREPEWVLAGTIHQQNDLGYCIGSHCNAPLLIAPNGEVFKIAKGDVRVHFNAHIRQLAECLTLRKRAGRGKLQIRTESDVHQLMQLFLDIDSSALAEGSYWASYVQEVREQMLEMM
jgi:hypothetical protein